MEGVGEGSRLVESRCESERRINPSNKQRTEKLNSGRREEGDTELGTGVRRRPLS